MPTQIKFLATPLSAWYASRLFECSIVLKPRSDRIDYTVVCIMTHDCSSAAAAESYENTVRPVRAECHGLKAIEVAACSSAPINV